MSEHSDRARYVTEQVALWIANDYNHYPKAFSLAEQGDTEGFTQYLLQGIRQAPMYSAPWYVRQELAPNDYDRIHWEDVANQLTGD